MFPRPLRSGLLRLTLLAAAACGPRSPTLAIRVAPGPAPARPTFTLPVRSDALYGLAVVPCGGGAPVWQFGTGGGLLTRAPTTITYGEVPAGYALRVGPEPLAPGCYEVFAGGAAGRFTVRPDGTVVPESAPAGAPAGGAARVPNGAPPAARP